MISAGRSPSPVTRRSTRAAIVLLVAVAMGCARHPAAATAPPAPPSPGAATSALPAAPPPISPPPAPPRVTRPAPPSACSPCTTERLLRAELDTIFAAPTVLHAILGIEVQSLDTGDLLYELNPDTLLVPASNMKIVTLGIAAARLGWDFRFETRLETAAAVDNGTLNGDLVIVGRGDPTILPRQETGSVEAFEQLTDALLDLGIRRIAGRVVGDGRAFSGPRWGFGWGWDEFAFGYQAPVGALQYNENLVEVRIRPGPTEGDPGIVEVHPDGSGLLAVNRILTGARGSTTTLDLFRFPGASRLEVRGTIAAGSGEARREAAVADPALFFARAFRNALVGRGVAVDGDAVSLEPPDDGTPATSPEPSGNGPAGVEHRLLARYLSPPLSEIGKTLMKASQNLYAETLLRALSLAPGPASVESSQKIEDAVLGSWGIAPGEYALADGSGLSRYNLVSASAILRILQTIARSPELAGPFQATLPVAGRDGTLANRMRATRAEGNVVAKTGSLMRVRALSGYLTTADGERLVFSMIANHYTVPTRTVDALMEQALERLASFTRGSATK